jgi:hypothetical protein
MSEVGNKNVEYYTPSHDWSEKMVNIREQKFTSV